MHKSILKKEILEFFSEMEITTFVDATLGAGGHAEAILEAHPEITTFIGIDQDPDALAIASARLEPWKAKTMLLRGNFSAVIPTLKEKGITSVEGILFDLGVSSMQLDRPEKGFSFSKEGPLDMRMDPQGDLTAQEIVNEWPQEEIARIFRDYGEEKRWRRAAQALVFARKHAPITTTTQLTSILRPVLEDRKSKIHPLTRVFQALRICVNRELAVVDETLPMAIDLLAPGGRLAIMSFHSLEDRIVKNHLRHAADDKEDSEGLGGGLFLDKEPIVKILTRKPMIAGDEEVEENPRSRSAKLRVIEKL